MTHPFDHVEWPALLKYAGDAELHYIASAEAWLNDPALQAHRYRRADMLIDVTGRTFRLDSEPCRPAASERRVALAEVIEMVRGHFAQLGACCVAKFSATDYRAAFEAIRDAD